MVKKIVRDPFFLQQKSDEATESDKKVVTDLLDTLEANKDRCVGMAANMIGVRKRVIVVIFWRKLWQLPSAQMAVWEKWSLLRNVICPILPLTMSSFEI